MYILTPDGTFVNTACGGEGSGKTEKGNAKGAERAINLITSLRLLNTTTGEVWDQKIADVPEGYEEEYHPLGVGRTVSPSSFKFTPMTSAAYEAGISGMKYTALIYHTEEPTEKYDFPFQTLFIQFPSETRDLRTFSELQDAKISASAFNNATEAVSSCNLRQWEPKEVREDRQKEQFKICLLPLQPIL